MSIQADKINVRFSSRFVLRNSDPERGTKTVVLDYEIFQQGWTSDTVLESGSFAMPIMAIDSEMIAVDASLQNKATARLNEVRTHHASIGAINDHSLFDADLILDGWKFYELAGQWHATHTVSGSFSDMLDPTLVNRINALLVLVLPPPTWAWASSPSPGQLEVSCVEVSGADYYAVYDTSGAEPVHLGDVPDNTPNTLAVPAGFYFVAVAAVSGTGRVGIMSVKTQVTIE